MERLEQTNVCLVCGEAFHPWPTTSNSELCSQSCSAIRQHARGKFGARGRKAWNSGIKTGKVPRSAFKKGHVPWNKGSGTVDPVVRKLRSVLSIAIKRSIRSNSPLPSGIERYVGWSIDEFRRRMEPLFAGDMSWNSYGTTWTIDHITPVSAFNITSKQCDDFRKCWALENLQPLTKSDNSKKGCRLLALAQHELEGES